MKRYNVYENSDARESIDGAWVLHADHEVALAARDDQWATAIAKYTPFDICKMIAEEMERGAA